MNINFDTTFLLAMIVILLFAIAMILIARSEPKKNKS